ncbi:nucleotidyltransferase [Falsibacillus pallidus]|uniref:tRNA(Met) cytidine acetate ligase n=1 Tax=Falsibacillus pallidus TaxID=493781 RepID=A0A370GWD6_9BACI|nr:nucleotidyltransferase [Falsibacillus pallidus]RDI47570.1 putative nucleotidyltransferase [Falsibacillus pallidus]
MKAAGVVVEYNPFHNGHLHHLEESKKMTEADVMIAVMSGNFLQRGEPALVSKWARTKMALKAGVDIVIELPYAFAAQQADQFAFGAISLLDAMNCSSYCFGSESGNPEAFERTLQYVSSSEKELNHNIKSFMKQGMSYPSALSHAYTELGLTEADYIDLTKPNNILGFHYMKAEVRIGSNMKAYTIPRKNADYHDEDFTSATIASATSIRKAIFSPAFKESVITQYIPPSSARELASYKEEFGRFHQWEDYWPLLQYKLLSMPVGYLREIYEVEEGIEYRLKECAIGSTSFKGFMERVKTKRYTWTRIQRMCIHILTNAAKKEMKEKSEAPEYIRLLGMSSNGRRYLNEVKKDLKLPIISKLSSADKDMIHLDVNASNIYAMGLQEPFRGKLMKLEFASPPKIV